MLVLVMLKRNTYCQQGILLTVVQEMLQVLNPALACLNECTLHSRVAFHSPFDMSTLHAVSNKMTGSIVGQQSTSVWWCVCVHVSLSPINPQLDGCLYSPKATSTWGARHGRGAPKQHWYAACWDTGRMADWMKPKSGICAQALRQPGLSALLIESPNTTPSQSKREKKGWFCLNYIIAIG